MAKYRFTFSSRLGTRVVIPLNGKGWQKNYDQKDNRAEFEETFNGDLVLAADDFNWLYSLEKLVFRNEYVKAKIEKQCGSGYSLFFSGSISLNSGTWDLERCTVTLKFSESEKYLLWETNKEVEVDGFILTSNRVTVNTIVGELERGSFNGSGPETNGGYGIFPGLPNPASKGWVMEGYQSNKDVLDEYTWTSYWVREIYNAPGVPVGNWIFDPDVNKYVREPVLYGQTTTYGPNNTIFFSAAVFSSTIDNGLAFNSFFPLLINFVLPGYTVQSDFFQINPLNPSALNYVTGQKSKVNNLVVFQKSDVKRAADFQNATRMKLIPEKFINSLCNMFQLEWKLKGKVFIIEHVKYRNQVLGLDTTVSPTNYKRRVYSYDNDKIPQKETFTFMETSFGDFAGVPILYSGANVAKGTKKEENYEVDNVTTDVIFLLKNPDPDGKASDEGLVIIATDGNGGILSEAPIIGGNELNNTLAWAQLQRDYWRWNRPQLNFNMNNVNTVALSVKPTKLEENVTIKICCGQPFDPDKLIKTNIGNNGILKNAKYNLFTEFLNVSVLFPAEDGLINIKPPVATTDYLTTFTGIDVSGDVLLNDTSDAGIDPNSLVIIQPPSFGTAVIMPDKKIKYTPNGSYTGKDYVTYSFKDIYGQLSNNGLIVIDILGGTALPIANPDNYTTNNKSVYNVPVNNGLSANDSGPIGVTVVPEQKATAKGGSVNIFSNGSFAYTPPAGIVGVDNFDYTLTDGTNTSVGNVTVNVFNTLNVYVALVRISNRTELNNIECPSGPELGGSTFYGTYVLRFFSDPGLTVPLNVNGYNLTVNVANRLINSDTGNDIYNYVDPFVVSGGTEVIYRTDFIESANTRNCAGEEVHLQGDLTLLAGTDYIGGLPIINP